MCNVLTGLRVSLLGYPGFFPPKPGQDEDVLSETRVRTGFVLGHQVSVSCRINVFLAPSFNSRFQAETFSAQAIINENLNAGDTLNKLEDLINEVFKRRADRVPSIPYVCQVKYDGNILMLVKAVNISYAHKGNTQRGKETNVVRRPRQPGCPTEQTWEECTSRTQRSWLA
jgi:hypothetical protein